jgi:putative hydrolase of the HAD superfamily
LPSVLLLDLDDTIVVHSSTSDPCWREVCDRYAAKMEDLSADQLFDAIKVSGNIYWDDEDRHRRGRLDLPKARREVVVAAFSQFGLEDEELAHAVADAYTEGRKQALYLFPGAIETLQQFLRAGIRLGLVTNGTAEEQRYKIERFQLAPHFEHIFIEGEMGMGKPDVRVFEHVLDTFGIEAQEAWMVGDNLVWDVAAPQKLGIFSVWIDLGGNGTPPLSTVRPDLIVSSLADLAAD